MGNGPGLLVFASLVAAAPLLARAEPGDVAQTARQRFETGTKLYNVGEYRDALQEFKLGYLAKPDPAFLFNMAQCYRMLGEHAQAVRQYRAYLREQPNTGNRAEIERHIADSEAKLQAATPPPATPPPPPSEAPAATAPPPPPSEKEPPPAGSRVLAGSAIVALLLGLGAAFGTIGAFAAASNDAAEAHAALAILRNDNPSWAAAHPDWFLKPTCSPPDGAPTNSATYQTYVRTCNDGSTMTGAGVGLAIGTAVLVAAGVALGAAWIITGRRAALRAGPGGMSSLAFGW
jgi:tetratricopeptide (TPR) repeat protein